jgi:hypothetical protein
MGMVKQDDGWRLPDELWEQMAPLLHLESRIRWAVTIHECQIAQP